MYLEICIPRCAGEFKKWFSKPKQSKQKHLAEKWPGDSES